MGRVEGFRGMALVPLLVGAAMSECLSNAADLGPDYP